MTPLIFSFVMFLLSGLSALLLYNEKIILTPGMYLIVSLIIALVYIYIRRGSREDKRADKLTILAISVFMSNILTSLIRREWELTNIISQSAITKISTVILVLSVMYLNFLYVRAEYSYKKKRGNQRIQEEPEESLFTQLFSNKKERDDDDVFLVLGKSADNEDV